MSFVYCEKCGKKLIERKSGGLWHFVFGKSSSEDDVERRAPVEMFIHGSLRMRCLRRSCGHWNKLDFFPSFQSDESEISCLSKE